MGYSGGSLFSWITLATHREYTDSWARHAHLMGKIRPEESISGALFWARFRVTAPKAAFKAPKDRSFNLVNRIIATDDGIFVAVVIAIDIRE